MTKEEVRKLSDDELKKKCNDLNDPDLLICSAEQARRTGVDESMLFWTVDDLDAYFNK